MTGLFFLLLMAPPMCPTIQEQPADATAARIGKATITVADLDAKIADELCDAKLAHRKQIQTLRERALDALIDERLLIDEAARLGHKTPEALIEATVTDKVGEPSAAEIKAFFTANAQRMRGATLEQMHDRIAEHLQQQARMDALGAFLTKLRVAAKVQTTLAPLRIPVDASGPSKGPKSAKVTIVEFADYQCPFCARGGRTLAALQARYGDKLRVVFKDFPLPFHPNAVHAAVAARCALEQAQFWPMHHRLFAHQDTLSPDELKAHAREIKGIDPTKFDACMANPAMAEAVHQDEQAGRRAGVTGTPAYFVNGIPIEGAQPLEAFVPIIERELSGP